MAKLKARVDFVEILETAYAAEPNDTAWGVALSSVVRNAIDSAEAAGLLALGHGENFEHPTPLFHASANAALDAKSLELWSSPMGQDARREARLLFYPGRPFVTHGELALRLSPVMRSLIEASREGAADACGFLAYPLPGVAVVLWNFVSEVRPYRRGERAQLYRLAAHVESAFRLRLSPEAAVAALVSPEGKLLELVSGAAQDSERKRLAMQVVALDRRRMRSRRHSPEALDDWGALLAGKYSVVPREDSDGKRYYVLIDNAPAAQRHARLQQAEIDVLTLAARGYTGKDTAYALGIAASGVSTLLARAASKLGLRSRVALIKVASSLFGVNPEQVRTASLSQAERDVLDLLRRGLSNAEIARLRSRSQNTVANQIAAILRKTSRPNRRALYQGRLEP